MNQEVIEKAKKLLLEKKANLEKELSTFATKDPNLKGDWDTKYPRVPEGDIEDAAGEVEEYATKLHIEFSLENQLKNVDSALEKIEKKTYGKCEECSKEIDQERLLISPEAKLCGKCVNKN